MVTTFKKCIHCVEYHKYEKVETEKTKYTLTSHSLRYDMLYTNESLLKPEELMLDPVHAKMTTKC